MLDIQLLRNDIKGVADGLKKRGVELDAVQFQRLESTRKSLQSKTQELQAKRNEFSKKIGELKKEGEDASSLLQEMSDVSTRLKIMEGELSDVQHQVREFLSNLPNLPHISVPTGASEADNELIRKMGEPPSFDYPISDHVDIGSQLGLLDLEAAAKVSGARFSVLKGGLAKMHRALVQFMLDIHTNEHGYTETYVPYLVNSHSVYGTGQLPKFQQDLFSLKRDDGESFYLIPTAEVPVTNLLRDMIVDSDDLPVKFVCHTPCFRSEAGSYGRDTRGMIRQHQFDKVELVQFCKPQESYKILESLTSHAEEILKRLDLSYRVMLLCSKDMGFSSAKTYDLEVWLPAQNCYREISSCSNFENFQSRRIMARYREEGNKPELLHTLNGSGLAVGRALVAIMENYQDEHGGVSVPDVLQKYMGGIKRIDSLG